MLRLFILWRFFFFSSFFFCVASSFISLLCSDLFCRCWLLLLIAVAMFRPVEKRRVKEKEYAVNANAKSCSKTFNSILPKRRWQQRTKWQFEMGFYLRIQTWRATEASGGVQLLFFFLLFSKPKCKRVSCCWLSFDISFCSSLSHFNFSLVAFHLNPCRIHIPNGQKYRKHTHTYESPMDLPFMNKISMSSLRWMYIQTDTTNSFCFLFFYFVGIVNGFSIAFLSFIDDGNCSMSPVCWIFRCCCCCTVLAWIHISVNLINVYR